MKRRTLGTLLKWSMLVVLVVAFVTGCNLNRSDSIGTYTISGLVTDGEGIGLDGVEIIVSGSTNSSVKTNEDGKWTAAVHGTVLVSPAKEGFFFAPLETKVDKPANDLMFSLQTRLSFDDGDPTITIESEGLTIGDAYVYRVRVREVTGIEGAMGYVLLFQEDYSGVFASWIDEAYGVSLKPELVLGVLDASQRIVATAVIPFGTYTKALPVTASTEVAQLQALSSQELSLEPLAATRYFASGEIEDKIYNQEDIPLSLEADTSAVFPAGYIIIDDAAVEFFHAFANKADFADLLWQQGQKRVANGGTQNDIDLFISLPDSDRLFNVRNGELVAEGEELDVQSTVTYLYDANRPAGSWLRRATVSVDLLKIDEQYIYRVWVQEVSGVAGSESYAVADPYSKAVALGEEITMISDAASLKIYILNAQPDDPDEPDPIATLYTISGSVVDEDANGIGDVTLSFTKEGFHATTKSSGGGTWEQGRLQGTIRVTPTKAGYNFEPTYMDITAAATGLEFIAYQGFVEDFAADLSAEWDTDWTFDTTSFTTAGRSMRSKEIGDNESTSLSIELEANADSITIAFDRRVSSERPWDQLEFYVDETLKGSWSGELDWERITYTINAEEDESYKFEWRYSKDRSQSAGEDGAWIDNIVITGVKKP